MTEAGRRVRRGEEQTGLGDRRAPLRRAMQILQLMVDRDQADIGVREVARALGVAPSSAYQILGMMEDAKIVQQDPASRRYSLTLELLRVAALVANDRDLVLGAARAHCDSLAAETREAVYLGLYDTARQQFMYVHYVKSVNPVNYTMALYEWLPIYSGAGAMAVLAFLPEKEARSLAEAIVMERRIRRVHGSLRQIEQELAGIRERGYVLSVAQRINGAVGIGSPIIGAGSRVLGNVVLALPLERLAAHDSGVLGRKVAEVARTISREVGGEFDYPGSVALVIPARIGGEGR